ncbi:Amidohydrolase family protein [Promicromonospora umidemergens]|nr:amidohydrolase family protein [Promicromonospora umidemergens]MCP2283387.1 Amidohydrolase family protein [Promicromonospora umidemergens]
MSGRGEAGPDRAPGRGGRQRRRRPPAEVFFDLLVADRLRTSILQHVGDEQNVREEGVLSLAEMIVHLAARPAARLGLHDRGRIVEGFVADVVVFDPATVADRATPDEPRLTAAGIPWVLVGGTPMIEDGERTGSRPGRALRHGSRSR